MEVRWEQDMVHVEVRNWIAKGFEPMHKKERFLGTVNICIQLENESNLRNPHT
jgi:hypothetical protein